MSIALVAVIILSSCHYQDGGQINPAETTGGPDCKELAVGSYIAISVGESERGENAPVYEATHSLEQIGLVRQNGSASDADMAGKTASFGTDEGTYVYARSSYSYMDDQNQLVGSFYSVYDSYSMGDVTLEKLRGTELVTLYSEPAKTNNTSSLLDLDAIQNKAVSCMKDNMDIVLSSDYVCGGTDNDALNRQYISYYRVLHGYRTDDSISLWFNKDLSLSGINARRYGSFASIASKLTKEKLEEAEATLTSLVAASGLPEGYQMHEPTLTTSNEGRVFMQAAVSYTTSDGLSGMDVVYINVN